MTENLQRDIVSVEIVGNKILLIRGKRVMLDRDLAELYGVETRILNQVVRRNRDRFPEDFMFQLNNDEFENWKSQFVISNSEKMGIRKKPFAFTEHGVTMLSSVLRSKRAVQINIQVVRAFVKMREFLKTNEELAAMVKENREAIIHIFKIIESLKNEEVQPKKKIGFHAEKK
ncbi:MAG: ORF6N domain-containing protein [Candidatus Omnitrophica bacterium]|nr:ORF6N domain-containing protein [Candidatus Omnitrophota bacterium]